MLLFLLFEVSNDYLAFASALLHTCHEEYEPSQVLGQFYCIAGVGVLAILEKHCVKFFDVVLCYREVAILDTPEKSSHGECDTIHVFFL